MTKRASPLAALAAAVLLGAPAPAAAQGATGEAGELRITTRTQGGRPLAEAAIVIEARDGNTWNATTDADGAATARLAPGFYQVAASHADHVRVVEPAVRVVRGKTVPVALAMRRSRADEEIVVVATAIRKDAFGSVASSYLDRDQLRTATGSGADVLRALDGLPGLVSRGDFANFTVRGRGPRDNLILVDGFPYDKVVHFDSSLGEQEDIEGGGRFSIFAPNLINGAEFSPGGWSAAYGGRSGSMLKLEVAQGNPSPSASLRLDLAGAELVYDGPSGFHEGTSIITSVRQFNFGRLFDVIGENGIGNPVMTDFILKTHTEVDSQNAVELLVLHTPERFARDVEHVLQTDNLEDRELMESDQDSTLIGATWTHLLGNAGRWQNRVFYRDTAKTSREGEAFPASTPMDVPAEQVPSRRDILTLVEEEREFGWRSDLALANRFGVLNAGLRISDLDIAFRTTLSGPWARYHFDGGDFRPTDADRFIVLTPEDTDSAYARSARQYAGFAEQVFDAGEWNLRAGLRYEHDGFSEEGYLSPRFSVSYLPSARTRIAATAGTFWQSPRYLDRAADPANFGLGNERVDHLSVGVERKFRMNWSALVEAYYQRLDDLVTEPDAVTGVAGNNGEGTSYGVDVVANRRFADGWAANAVYSYNEATRNDNDGGGDYPPDYHHEHLLSVGARWEINHRWQLGMRWKYVTGRPRDEFTIHEDVLAGIGGPLRYAREFTGHNTRRWDDFHTLNMRLDYRRPIGPVDMIAFLDILNVYGAASTDEQEFDTATGNLVVEGEGEIFPLIGLRFEKSW